ncbi:hypothetical protein [Psychromarinibacter sp. S121]|uniref:hypothetical protein n=1 Tax=Psychromarinibacter sp. S121 TaxID=3415127 RepID=UPI003C79BAF0
MTTRTESTARFVPQVTRRKGLLAWLLQRDAQYRESRKMQRMTPEQRRDVGLPASDAPMANKFFLTGQW